VFEIHNFLPPTPIHPTALLLEILNIPSFYTVYSKQGQLYQPSGLVKLADIILLNIALQNSIRATMLLVFVTITFTIALCSEFSQLRRSLLNAKSNPQRRLCDFRERHYALARFVVHYDARLNSVFFFCYILCSLCFVIYILIVLLYKSHFGTQYFAIYIYTLIGLQFVAPAMLFAANVCTYTSMYGSIPALYRLLGDQQLLSRRRIALRERWKSLTYYEMMHRKQRRPFLFTAGLLGTITTKSLLKVIYFNLRKFTKNKKLTFN